MPGPPPQPIRRNDAGEPGAEIARELGLDATEVANILRGLSTSAAVVRTDSGNWELTPAAARTVEPRPHPKEPEG